MYGLAGMACVGIVWFTVTGRALLSKEQPQTTIDNVEANIRAWADSFSYTITKENPSPNQYFLYLIVLHSGGVVFVSRNKDKGRYLKFQGNIALAKNEQENLFNQFHKNISPN